MIANKPKAGTIFDVDPKEPKSSLSDISIVNLDNPVSADLAGEDPWVLSIEDEREFLLAQKDSPGSASTDGSSGDGCGSGGCGSGSGSDGCGGSGCGDS